MRTLVVWCPDWPVFAAGWEAGCDSDAPIAVLDKSRVYACSRPARRAGVKRGQRVREAQASCPELITIPYDQTVDARVFEPVIATVEALAPGVEVVRPGICAVGVRGPARYFGGEHAFADVLHSRLEAGGYTCVFGVADGLFAAEQAARSGLADGYAEFPAGESASCLAPLSIDTLERPELVDLLRRLGIRTLGAFAELPRTQVLTRFGIDGALAHRLASGQQDRPLATRRPPPELDIAVDLEPPVERVDQVAFAVRKAADQLVSGLAERDLVCGRLRVEVHTEDGGSTGRAWRHPRWFDAADVVDRVRWQLQGIGGLSPVCGVSRVRLIPDEVNPPGVFAEGLWGERAPDERIHRGLTRVQSMLGQEAVLTAVRSGGRSLVDRITLIPWGDERVAARPPESEGQPWPGQLPVPAPSVVPPKSTPVELFDAARRPIRIDERGAVSATPAVLAQGRTGESAISGWAGPWPVDERWWDRTQARSYARLQVGCADGAAYVLRYEAGRWWIEARYE